MEPTRPRQVRHQPKPPGLGTQVLASPLGVAYGPAYEGIERGGISLERRQRAQLGALDSRAAGLLGHEQGKGLDFGKLGHAGYCLRP
jgi:hypothetical protein